LKLSADRAIARVNLNV
jgi:hypothetical protein